MSSLVEVQCLIVILIIKQPIQMLLLNPSRPFRVPLAQIPIIKSLLARLSILPVLSEFSQINLCEF
jgi:hypothetical protein